MGRLIQPVDIPTFDDDIEIPKNIESESEPKKTLKTTIEPVDTPSFEDEEPVKKKSNYLKEELEEPEEQENEHEEIEQNELSESDIEEVKSLFQKMQDMGVFIGLPEDFEFDGTPEKLEEAFQIDQDTRYALVQKDLLSRIQDPMLREAIDYGINGGTLADFDTYLQLQKDLLNAEIEIKNEEQAKNLIIKKLQSQGIKDDKIIELYLEDIEDTKGTFMEAGKEAAEYFKKEVEKRKEMLVQQAKQIEAEERAVQEEYEKAFINALKESKMSQKAQDTILSMFDPIRLKNGVSYPRHELIRYQIEENPAHYIQFLDFLATYDPEKGFDISKFKSQGKTEQTKKIYDILKQSETKSKGRTVNYTGKNNTVFRNPVDSNIIIN
ncbi:MAG: hypothetical protein KatS3mg002_1371 [Candidatus Woesearchaeota archaeon]|nr:MAG: hypothetical protein KatS3mg002_1371 [Candidatus Woesearchaeota archaeon]